MKKTTVFMAIATALMLTFAACEKEEETPANNNGSNTETPDNPTPADTTGNQQPTAAFPHNTSWESTLNIDTTVNYPISETYTAEVGFNVDFTFTLDFHPTADSAVFTIGFNATMTGLPIPMDPMSEEIPVDATFFFDATTNTGTITFTDPTGEEQPAVMPFTYTPSPETITITLPTDFWSGMMPEEDDPELEGNPFFELINNYNFPTELVFTLK